MKTNILEIVTDFDRAGKLFEQSARAWERANGDISSNLDKEDARKYYEKQMKKHERLSDRGEELLQKYGISCSWPGLYPVFVFRGAQEYALNSILARLEVEV